MQSLDMVLSNTQSDGSLQMDDDCWPSLKNLLYRLWTKSPEQLLIILRTDSLVTISSYTCRGQTQCSYCVTHSCWLSLSLSLSTLSNRLSWWGDLIGQKWSPYSLLWPHCWTGQQHTHAYTYTHSSVASYITVLYKNLSQVIKHRPPCLILF